MTIVHESENTFPSKIWRDELKIICKSSSYCFILWCTANRKTMSDNENASTKSTAQSLKEKRAFHIIKAFLEVTEGCVKRTQDLHAEMLRAYIARIDFDPDISDAVRPLFLDSKSEFSGKSLWNRAREYKRNIINIYKPNLPKIAPSGSNEDDLFEICRKKSWCQIKNKSNTTTVVGPGDCPLHWKPIEFWAFRQLHNHPKFTVIEVEQLKGDVAAEQEQIRKKVDSRRQQRSKERMQKKRKAEQEINTGLNPFHVEICKREVDIKLVRLALQCGDKKGAKKLFKEVMNERLGTSTAPAETVDDTSTVPTEESNAGAPLVGVEIDIATAEEVIK